MSGYNPVVDRAAAIMDDAEYVSINDDEPLAELAAEYAATYDDGIFVPDWQGDWFPEFLPADAAYEEVVQAFMVGNALNYCFNSPETGEFGIVYEVDGEEKTFERSKGMWASIRRAYETGEFPIMDATALSEMTPADVHELFRPGPGYGTIPMPETRAAQLQSVGETLINEYDGHAVNLFDAAEGYLFHPDPDERGIIARLTEMDAFGQDEFLKRAQLLPSMLHGRLGDAFPLHDIDEFTVFADYRLPQLLQHKGILRYDSALTAAVDDQRDMVATKADQQMEREIRAATVIAGQRLQDEINARVEGEITVPELDALMWKQAKDMDNAAEFDLPHHIAYTTDY